LKGLALHPNYGLYERKGKPFCSSLQVADAFKKRHDHVLRDIENLDCSESFRLPNYGESSYLNEQNKKQPMYYMTKDGFIFLVMGYRGEKAATIKEAYINRFNSMEAFIAEQYAAKMEHPEFTKAVEMSHDEPKTYHFSNESDMINRIVLGVPAKAIREANGLKPGESIRPCLTGIQVGDIRALQIADVGMLLTGKSFQERKAALAEYHSCRKIIKLSA
jgi:Rha family phage regulatory protein